MYLDHTHEDSVSAAAYTDLQIDLILQKSASISLESFILFSHGINYSPDSMCVPKNASLKLISLHFKVRWTTATVLSYEVIYEIKHILHISSV